MAMHVQYRRKALAARQATSQTYQQATPCLATHCLHMNYSSYSYCLRMIYYTLYYQAKRNDMTPLETLNTLDPQSNCHNNELQIKNGKR